MKKTFCILITLLCVCTIFIGEIEKNGLFLPDPIQAIELRHPLIQWKDEKNLLEFKEEHPTLDFHFLDVGQGDSTLIVSDSGKAILVDGGTEDQGEKVVEYLKKEGIDRLEWVVATHPDIDHIGGLIHVLDEIEVDHMLDSGKKHTTATYKRYRKKIKEKGIPLVTAQEGDSLETDIADIFILHAEPFSSVRNQSSIVLHVSDGKSSVLLTGDATVKSEKEMLKLNDVQADVLKVAHHGSSTSTSHAFLKAVAPEIAILPYDKENEYGHPNAGVVKRLRNNNITLYTTEESGNIQVILYEGKIYIAAKPWEGRGRIRIQPAS